MDIDPKLLEILVCPVRQGKTGADQQEGGARLSHPRRHPHHAAGRGAPIERRGDGVSAPWPSELRLNAAKDTLTVR
jgi:uncharacterized protein YbaR (Trm112 family)